MNNKQQKRLIELYAMVPGSPVATRVLNGDLSGAMRRFKKYMKTSGRLEEVQRRSAYVPDSITRRHQKQAAIFNQKKARMLDV